MRNLHERHRKARESIEIAEAIDANLVEESEDDYKTSSEDKNIGEQDVNNGMQDAKHDNEDKDSKHSDENTNDNSEDKDDEHKGMETERKKKKKKKKRKPSTVSDMIESLNKNIPAPKTMITKPGGLITKYLTVDQQKRNATSPPQEEKLQKQIKNDIDHEDHLTDSKVPPLVIGE